MLAYRHAFHAGNHADVLKHVVLLSVLRYLNRKAKPYRFVDTHAGAGGYALDGGYAQKNAEFAGGIGRLWDRTDLPAPVADYVAAVRAFNGPGPLRTYPGSPALTRRAMRTTDGLCLFERHPADHALLVAQVGDTPGTTVFQADGFAGLARQLPPSGGRGAVLIDPSYELRTDYAATVRAVREALAKLPDAVVAVWYPQLAHKPESARLPEELTALVPRKGWLHARLTVGEPDADGFGMAGSGMVVLNPPFVLRDELAATLPYLATHLGLVPGASFLLESSA